MGVYLDYAASTPLDHRVFLVMEKYYRDVFANPSSIHGYGREARQGIDVARRQVASLIGSQRREIVFTGGGTEANNLAIRGLVKANSGRHLITSVIEHPSVLEVFNELEREGYRVSYLPVNREGKISLEDLEREISDDTVLISIMMANNEVGVIQPVREIVRLAHSHGVLFHTDAIQAVGQMAIDVKDLGVDSMTLSAHKIYGPKGVGALYVKAGVQIHPLLVGGSQERKRRAGTENVPGIVGFGQAAELAKEELDERIAHYTYLRDRLIKGVLRGSEGKLTGSMERLPNNAHFVFEGLDGEMLLMLLDNEGLAVSGGSACGAGTVLISPVLTAMGYNEEAGIRVSIGMPTTKEEIDQAIEIICSIVNRG